MVRRRNNIALVKRDSPHKVTLPNGRTFYAKYRRVTKEYLKTYAAAVRRLPAWLLKKIQISQ